jgi:uncharacterized protein YggU (UPF0235/DUF167 family)
VRYVATFKRSFVAEHRDEMIDVVVKPGSRKPGLSSEDGALVLRVRERAIEGAGNDVCLRALAQAYGVAPSAVSLVRGLRSRHKRFAIHGSEKPKDGGKATQ